MFMQLQSKCSHFVNIVHPITGRSRVPKLKQFPPGLLRQSWPVNLKIPIILCNVFSFHEKCLNLISWSRPHTIEISKSSG